MIEINPSKLVHISAQIGLGTLGVAVITAVCFAIHLGFAIPSLLFMLLVVALSLWSGFVPAAMVSVVAALCLDYFFIPPVLQWQIGDPEYGVALLTYWATSLVITRLASRARNDARVAEQRRKDAGLLYEAAARLLSLAPEIAGPESLGIFRDVFALRAVSFFDADLKELRVEGRSDCALAERTRDASILGTDYRSEDNDLFIRCIRAGERITGAIGFEGRFENEGIAPALSLLAAAAFERTRSFSAASKAAADAQADILRSAILDAFAHEFKTPLAIILAAAGGLRDSSAEADREEMTDIIENQTVRLNQLTSRLLRTARLDRNDVTLNMEPTSLNAVAGNLVEQYRSLFGRRISANLHGLAAEVLADPELLSLAINQLLDNACKYSAPDSAVIVNLSVKNGCAEISVSNDGPPIRAEERERIFQRFVRGTDTEQVAAGAGLGLYVARKILRAHSGSLELDPVIDNSCVTTFRISLPVIQDEATHEQEAHQSAGG